MSFKLDLAMRDNHTAVLNLPKTPAQTVEHQMELATTRLRDAVFNDYSSIKGLSMYWSSDDTGGELDSNLFINTISKLGQHCVFSSFSMSDDTLSSDVISHVRTIFPNLPSHEPATATNQQQQASNSRTLFILHYAGHGWGGPDSLHLCARTHEPMSDEEPEGPSFSFASVKDSLKEIAKARGVDLLLLMDCCCAAAGSRKVKRSLVRARVEFVAATTERGVSNSTQDGETFTQSWCAAFERMLATGAPFEAKEVVSEMRGQKELAQYPAVIVLDEGMDLPISFRPQSFSMSVQNGQNVLSQLRTVIAAFHLDENPDTDAIQQLVQFLQKLPIPISILATLPARSTLVLVRMPSALQYFLSIVPVLLLEGM